MVFGVNCSPFLPAAVLKQHLRTARKERILVADKLLKSLHVENCVTSVDTVEKYAAYRLQATELMAETKMDSQKWEYSVYDRNENTKSVTATKVVGLVWNKECDTLSFNIPQYTVQEKITKCVILSYVNQIFDLFVLLALLFCFQSLSCKKYRLLS